jgi:hypothetical protein
MPRHEYRGVSLDPPADWIDRTIVAFSAPAQSDNKSAPNLVITNEPMREGDTLRVCADRQLMEIAKQLQDFDICESTTTTVGGLPAISMRFTWTAHFGALEQTITLVERTTEAGRVVTSFAATAKVQDAKTTHGIFENVLKSVSFGPPAAVTHSEPPRPLSQPPPSRDPEEPFVPMPGYRQRR